MDGKDEVLGPGSEEAKLVSNSVDIKIDSKGNGSRNYNIVDSRTGKTFSKSRWHFYSKDFFIQAAVHHEKENGGDIGLTFFSNGDLEFDEKIGERVVEFHYGEDGSLNSVKYLICGDRDDESDWPREFFIIGGSLDNSADGIEPDEFEVSERKDGKKVIRRVEKRKVLDEIIVPQTIDVEDLRTKFAPLPLLKDPTTEETIYDQYWKDLDPVHEAGIRWEALENDQYNSLGRDDSSISSSDAHL